MLLNSKQVPTSSSRVHLKLANAMCTYKLYDFAHLFMLTFIFLSFIFIQIELDEMLNIEIQMLPRRVVGSSLIVHENGPNHVQVEINRWPSRLFILFAGSRVNVYPCSSNYRILTLEWAYIGSSSSSNRNMLWVNSSVYMTQYDLNAKIGTAARQLNSGCTRFCKSVRGRRWKCSFSHLFRFGLFAHRWSLGVSNKELHAPVGLEMSRKKMEYLHWNWGSDLPSYRVSTFECSRAIFSPFHSFQNEFLLPRVHSIATNATQ